MNGSYAFGDGFDRGGGGDLRRSRLGNSDFHQGRPSHFGGGMSDFHSYGDRGGERGGSLLYGGSDVDPRHYGGGGGRDSDYGDDYYGRNSHHYSEDPRYGGRGPSRDHHGHYGGRDKFRDSLLMPEEDAYYSNESSLDGSASSFKTPPPSSPPPEGGTRPGDQFCSSHDAVSAKIAAFDGKGGMGAAAAPQIEIAPGLSTRLRGAKETWEAVENDFYMPCSCFCCQKDLLCIMDANYVLCPMCKVVSPLEGCAAPGSMEGGCGLGFTMEDLAQWQYEIVNKRRM